MIIELPLFSDSSRRNQSGMRPIRMGFFHFSNNNLSIRKECAREVGMYDINASKSEDVDLCFRVALSPKWIAWREDEAVVRHKGRRTLWDLITQMWGWGLYVGYPYAKTGVRGVFLYWLDGRNHKLIGRFETGHFPILVCGFATDFYFVNLLMILLILAACFGHWWLALTAVAGLFWAAPRYFSDIRAVQMKPWAKFKLAGVHYVTNVAFTVAAFAGALRHRVILIPSSVFRPDMPRQR
jgi:hypothetical protein